MQNIKKILDALFPFAITILLWRIATPVWNPNGILATIPIFYYSFIRPRSEFMPMAVVGCLLLDYNFGTLLFWTMLFCAAYAGNYLQTVTKPMMLIYDGLFAFALFVGAGLFMLAVMAFTWRSLGTAAWILALTMAGYFLWIRTIKNIGRRL
jgi:hypothetical protein